MALVAVACGAVIGLVIGGLGGGGGVLAIPALVYLLGQTPQHATTASLIIVGISAVVGIVSRCRGQGPDWRTGIVLGGVGTPAAHLGSLLNDRVDRPALLLTFAVVTVLAAGAMLWGDDPGDGDGDPDADGSDRRRGPGAERPPPAGRAATAVAARTSTRRRHRSVAILTVVVCGAAVGFLTGFLGVGGGFVVLPVLVLVLRMPVSRAVATSLLVILINSAVALLSRSGDLSLDWRVVVPFAVAAIAGTLLGTRVAHRLSGTALTRIFAALLLLVGVLVGADALGALPTPR